MNKVSNEIKITTQYFEENKEIELYKFGDLKVQTDKNLLKYLKANRVNLNTNYDVIFEYYQQLQKEQNTEILKNNFLCEIPELLQLRSYIDNLDASKLKEYKYITII
jgi:IS1 family transposase